MLADKGLTVVISQTYLDLAGIFFQHFLVALVNVMAQIYKLKHQSDLKNQFTVLN
jgi:hypothetical protein